MLIKLRIFTLYLLAFVLISCICGLVYVAVQQDLRLTANDPQIQIAEDSAAAIMAGKNPAFGTDKIDVATSLSPFLAIYDKDGNPTASNAQLDGQMPKPPAGVFQTAKQRGQYRVTWQPRPNVRQALVVVPVNNNAGQFVAAGRSLREVEKREQSTFETAAAAWAIMLVVSFVGIFIWTKEA